MSNRPNVLIIEDEDIQSAQLKNSLGVVRGANMPDTSVNNIMAETNGPVKVPGEEKMPFIFLTAYPAPIAFEQAKRNKPPAFVSEPFLAEDLNKAIHFALHHFQLPPVEEPNQEEKPAIRKDRGEQDAPLRFKDAIFIKHNYRYNKISFKDILYLKADGNHTFIYTVTKTYVIKYSLQALITQLLACEGFVRTHRSFAINMQHVSSFNETIAVIEDKEIPIGPNYRADFMKMFIR